MVPIRSISANSFCPSTSDLLAMVFTDLLPSLSYNFFPSEAILSIEPFASFIVEYALESNVLKPSSALFATSSVKVGSGFTLYPILSAVSLSFKIFS